MEKTNARNDFSKISPTAKIPSYWRSFSDIPYSKEIAEAVNAEETAKKMIGERPEALLAITPTFFEIRYKAINYGLKKCGISNVMELACGLSPRGLEVVAGGGTYVGTDLPGMFAESSPVILAIASRMGIPMENLHLQPANVLQEKELEDAGIHFGDQAFAVCNEGLLPYLTMEEKATMARNLRNLLKNGRGCWITTDIVYKEIQEKLSTALGPGVEKAVQNVKQIVGNDFIDKAVALKFYNDLGFEVEEFPLYAGDYTLSTGSLIPDNFMETFFNVVTSVKAWILTPKA
jgi:O-methyltransferase involved in polyketide biosynthesis